MGDSEGFVVPNNRCVVGPAPRPPPPARPWGAVQATGIPLGRCRALWSAASLPRPPPWRPPRRRLRGGAPPAPGPPPAPLRLGFLRNENEGQLGMPGRRRNTMKQGGGGEAGCRAEAPPPPWPPPPPLSPRPLPPGSSSLRPVGVAGKGGEKEVVRGEGRRQEAAQAPARCTSAVPCSIPSLWVRRAGRRLSSLPRSRAVCARQPCLPCGNLAPFVAGVAGPRLLLARVGNLALTGANARAGDAGRGGSWRGGGG